MTVSTDYAEAQLQALKDTPPWGPLAQTLISVVTVLVAIGGFIYTAQQFKLSSESTRETIKLQKEAQQVQKETQQDSEFFDLTHKLGDKDSPISRATAAILLCVFAQPNRYEFIPKDIVVKALSSALKIETEPFVLEFLGRTLHEINNGGVYAVGEVVDQSFQRDVNGNFMYALAKFVVASRTNRNDRSNDGAALDMAARVTLRPKKALEAVTKSRDYQDGLEAAEGLPSDDADLQKHPARVNLLAESTRSKATAMIFQPLL